MESFLICLVFFQLIQVTQLASLEKEETQERFLLGGAARTHLTALEHIPCAAARCVSSPCLALPRGSLSPAPAALDLCCWGVGMPLSRSHSRSLQPGLQFGIRESPVWFHPAAFNNVSALLSCPQFHPAISFRTALHLHYLPLKPSGLPI